MSEQFINQESEQTSVWPPLPLGSESANAVSFKEVSNGGRNALRCCLAGVCVEVINIGLCSLSKDYLESAVVPDILAYSGFLLWLIAICSGLTQLRSWKSIIAIIASIACPVAYVVAVWVD